MGTNAQKLIGAIEWAFSDYGRDFVHELVAEEDNLFTANVNYQFGEWSQAHEFSFPCRVEGGVCLMDFSEDCWYEITEENLFKFMFFIQTQRLEAK